MQVTQKETEFDFVSEMGHSFISVDLSTFAFILLSVFSLNL